jgi:hypothetical protein
MYREHEFVERCHCDAAADLACASCGRARCARHLERELCNRCSQYVGRELEARSGQPWVAGGTVGSTVAVAMLVAGTGPLAIVGIPVGFVAFFAHRVLQRRRLIAVMGPTLSASKGEPPPPDRTIKENFPAPGPNIYGP